jgi:hypothetical protein
MPALLTQKYRSFLAKQFLLAITSGQTGAYIFIGRPSPWVDTANVAVSDTNPPIPKDDVQAVDFDDWRDLLAAKRVTGASSNFVVPRRDWVTGTIYDQYDDLDENLAGKAYFVLDTLDQPFKVYKCLWNNKGAFSNVQPSVIGTTLTPQQTADGYVWQYMYTIDSLYASFLTTSWMPVLSDPSVQTNAMAIAGRLPTTVPLVIINGGASYNASVNVVTTLEGDGTGAAVTNNDVQITGGVVSSIVLATGGLGYTEVTSINVYQAGASTQASVRAIIPPYPNHGHDPIKELGAAALMLSAAFDQSEGGHLTVVNDYRRVGLLINPVEASNNEPASASFYRQTTDISISANTGVLLRDDVITNISKPVPRPTAIVVDVIPSGPNYKVRVVGVDDQGLDTPFAFGETIKNLTSGVEATVSGVLQPELVPYSGDIVWVNQRTPITRGSDQIEELKVVFPFK